MDYLLYEVVGRKGLVTLNRPEKRNALHPSLVSELSGVLGQAAGDEQVKVLILRANGSSFCAGADLEYLQQLQGNTLEENLADSNHLKAFFLQLYQFPKPTIAQVGGHAIAGGAGFVSVCDYVFMGVDAKIGYTEVRIGFVPAIVTPFLIRKVGVGRAKELLLSGKLYTADEAYLFGLVSRVVAGDQLQKEVEAFSDELIVSNSGESMAMTKKLIQSISDGNLTRDLELAAELNAKARSTESCKRGIRAFLEKKTIDW